MASMVKWGLMDRGTLFWPIIKASTDIADYLFYPERVLWQLKPYTTYSSSFFSYEQYAPMVTNAYNWLAYVISFSDSSKLRLLRIHTYVKNGLFSGKIANSTTIVYQEGTPGAGPYDIQYSGNNCPAETITLTNDIGDGFQVTIDPQGNVSGGEYYGGRNMFIDFSAFYYAA